MPGTSQSLWEINGERRITPLGGVGSRCIAEDSTSQRQTCRSSLTMRYSTKGNRGRGGENVQLMCGEACVYGVGLASPPLQNSFPRSIFHLLYSKPPFTPNSLIATDYSEATFRTTKKPPKICHLPRGHNSSSSGQV